MNDVPQQVVDNAKGWWQSFDLSKWLGEQSADAVSISICFVSFFAFGFLFKKYLKMVFLCLVLSVLIIKGLEYYRILDIDGEALKVFLGLEPKETISAVFNRGFDWMRDHVLVTISSTAGFLLGYKLG